MTSKHHVRIGALNVIKKKWVFKEHETLEYCDGFVVIHPYE